MRIITELKDGIVFLGEDNSVYVVENVLGTYAPDNILGKEVCFVGDCEEIASSDNPIFKMLGEYILMHDAFPDTEDIPSLFKGELCSHFKCDGWENYDFYIKDYIIHAVDKRVITARNLYEYTGMWEDGKVF